MNTKIIIVAMLLVFIALCWTFNADALNKENNAGSSGWFSCKPGQNKVIVYFNSDYMGTGRVARAKVWYALDTGLVLELTDVLGECGSLEEWLSHTIFFPYSRITSVRYATDKQWNRMKGTLKQFN